MSVLLARLGTISAWTGPHSQLVHAAITSTSSSRLATVLASFHLNLSVGTSTRLAEKMTALYPVRPDGQVRQTLVYDFR